MNEPHNPADPFGWFAQLGLGHQQWATLMRSTVQGSPLDARSKSQWDFALRQVIDATSPKNWLASNPEALQLALEITLALAVKFAAMIVIWHVWFSHPEGRQLNGERIGAMIYGTPPSAPRKD